VTRQSAKTHNMTRRSKNRKNLKIIPILSRQPIRAICFGRYVTASYQHTLIKNQEENKIITKIIIIL
jgi:hypothetical protein